MDILIRIMADGLIVLVVLIGGWALLFRLRDFSRLEACSRIIMAGLTSYLLAKLIGSIYQPEFERPFQLLGHAAGALYLNNPGFPSDHVLFCTAITTAVWFESRTRPAAYVLIVLTLLIAVGRVLALVHTPLDVVGGAAIGVVGALWYVQREKSAYAKNTESASRNKSKNRVK